MSPITDSSTAFVLVHGAWHGAWCFERLTPRLVSRGFTVVARDLPTRGADAAADADSVLASIGALRAAGHRRVLLLGHSMGCVVLHAVGERAPAKVDALIYLAGAMPASDVPPGAYFALPESASARVNPVLVGDPLETGVFRIDPHNAAPAYRAALRDAFYNDAEEADFEAARLCLSSDMPLAQGATPTALSAGRWGAVERHYILCERDHAVPPDLARRYIADADALNPGNATRVHALDTGHSPFLTAPDALADCLAGIAESNAFTPSP